MWYAVCAEATALLHGLIVLYIAGGFVAILLGLWRRWAFVRRFWFRSSHLGLCVTVALFELLDQPCPLTTLEQWLREQATAGSAYQGSFIAHCVHRLIHLAVPARALAVPMFILVLLAVALYFWRGPEKPERSGKNGRLLPSSSVGCVLSPPW